MPINTELLLKVRDAILAEPLKFNMEMWFLESDRSPCGTTACIAGHAYAIGRGIDSLKEAWLKNRTEEGDHSSEIACDMLGIDREGEEQARLFLNEHWPESFNREYDEAITPKKRAEVAARRIDHFIATEGRE